MVFDDFFPFLHWEAQHWEFVHKMGTHTQVALLMMGNTDTDTALGVGKGGEATHAYMHTHNANSHFGIYLDFCQLVTSFLGGGSGESVILSTAGSRFRARHCAYGTAHDF